RAVAAQHQADPAREDCLLHPRRGVADDLDHLAQVLSARTLAGGTPAPGLAIAVVAHLDPAVAKQRDQPGLPQRVRRLLLPGGEGAGAGRDPDHPERPARLIHAGASSAGSGLGSSWFRRPAATVFM